MDLAYRDSEIDNVRLFQEAIPKDQEADRISLSAAFENLRKRFALDDLTVWDLPKGKKVERKVFIERAGEEVPMVKSIDELNTAREAYWSASEDSQTPLRAILDAYQRLSQDVFSVRAKLARDRYDLAECDSLVDELSKEPVVYSEIRVTDDGCGYLELQLKAHALQMERAFEIMHRLRGDFLKQALSRGWRVCKPE
jgi:hypothetical protein